MDEWINDITFERHGPVRRLFKKIVFNPFANFLPASWMRGLLKVTESELAAANWKDPGGWRSMVISYEGKPKQITDKILVGAGSVPTALRNRKKLGSALIAHLIGQVPAENVHVLCLGAGPGLITIDALKAAPKPAHATLVDISDEAFAYGLEQAENHGVRDRVNYIRGDVRDIEQLLDEPPHVVKMIGICEYLTDDQIREIISAAATVMPAGTAIVFNSISKAHGTDRFFRRVFGLHMIHRSPEQLQALMASAGFGDFVAYPEPLGVYHMIVGRKLS
jgi:SAM-dependent methyltransferase